MIRLAIHVDFEGSKEHFAHLLSGSPEKCLSEVEFLAFLHFGTRLRDGFEIVLRTAGRSHHLTAAHLEEAYTWGLTDVAVSVRRLHPSWPGGNWQHGQWMHKAATVIQQKWRECQQWRQAVDAEDIVCTFDLTLSKRGVSRWNMRHLAAQTHDGSGSAVDPRLVELAIVLYMCRPLEESMVHLFRWAEQRAIAECMRHAVEFVQSISGLAFSLWPCCKLALYQCTRHFAAQLSCAFPWFKEPTEVQRLEFLAVGMAETTTKRCGRAMADSVIRQTAATSIYSAVLGHVLETVSSAIWNGAESFVDRELVARIMEMPAYRSIQHIANTLHPKVQDECFVMLRPQDLEGISPREVLLLPVRRSENFGVIFQATALFYGLRHARLSGLTPASTTSGRFQPDCSFAPDTPVAGIVLQRGPFVSLSVASCRPDPTSFECALLEIVQAVGSHFLLDRSNRILRLKLRPDIDNIAQEGGAYIVGDIVALPATYAEDSQYYHFYHSTERRMTCVRCPLHTLVKALRAAVVAHHGELQLPSPFIFLQQRVLQPTAVLSLLAPVQQQVEEWCHMASSACWLSWDSWRSRSRTAGASSGKSTGELLRKALDTVATQTAPRTCGAVWDRGKTKCVSGSPKCDYDKFLFPVPAALASQATAKLMRSPEVVMPVVAAAAASVVPSMLLPTLGHWGYIPVQSLSLHQAVLPSKWPEVLPLGATVASGALGGATVGSMLSPCATLLGAGLGAAVSDITRSLLIRIPEKVYLPNHWYVFPDGRGHSYLMHYRVSQQPMNWEAMMVAAVTQASLRGALNVQAYATGAVAPYRLGVEALKDCGTGAGLWALSTMIIHLLQIVEAQATGPLQVVAATALLHPALVTYLGLGAGLVLLELVRHQLTAASDSELRSRLFFVGSSTGVAITTHIVAQCAVLPFLVQVPLTVFAVRCGGVLAYEAWRCRQQRLLKAQLQRVALNIMGLPPKPTKEQIEQRFRVLARMAHPDRNKSPDARVMFQVLSACRHILLQDLRDADNKASGRLLRRLRCPCWALPTPALGQ